MIFLLFFIITMTLLPAQTVSDSMVVTLPKNARIELLPCRQSIGEVLFVPGLFSEKNTMMAAYGESLKAVFPHYSLAILKWETVSPKSLDDVMEVWPEAKRKADAMAVTLASHIASQSPAEQHRLVLVGHSIGCQVVVGTASLLGKRGLKIRRMILLGAALPFDSSELSTIRDVCLETPINVFNPNDFVLRYCFHNVEGVPALGLLGYKSRLCHWEEYSRFPEEQEIHDRRPKSFWDNMSAHGAAMYLTILREVITGNLQPAVKINHAAITFPKTLLSLPPSVSIPRLPLMTLHKTYFGWVFASFSIPELDLPLLGKIDRIYLLLNPFGQCCGWDVSRSPIADRFEAVQRMIEQQVRR